jgi:nucleoside-diphosphate-sugar epimerase
MGIDLKDKQYIYDRCIGIFQSLKDKSVFISGGTGFIGKWFIESIIYANKEFSLNIKLTVLSRNPELFKRECPHLSQNINFLKGDIRNFDYPDTDYDYIIHAATDASAQLNFMQPIEIIDIIYAGTKRILDFAKGRNVKNTLFISSGAIYGAQPDELPGFPETYTGGPELLQPGSSYGEAKRLAEQMCFSYFRLYEMNISVARCFAFVGPYLKLDSHYAIGNFIGNGLKNESISIIGDGKALRSYMYAAELSIWLWTILINGKGCNVYNVGSENAISIKDLAILVSSFFPGTKIEILNQKRDTDRNQNYIPDLTKAKKEFGFNDFIPLKDAISRTIDFYKSIK